MTVARLFGRRPRHLIAAVLAVGIVCGMHTSAFARGGSGAARMYMRIAQAEMKFMQQAMAAYQKQQKEQYDAFMKRFDTNRNGKIDGKEKGPATKYLRAIQLGKDPDKATRSLGRTTSSRAAFGK